MDNVYMLVADKIGWYARVYGWEHADSHWGNFLFSDDLAEVAIVEYVHWNLERNKPVEFRLLLNASL